MVTEPVTERYVGTDDLKILEEILFNRNTILVIDDIENLSTLSAMQHYNLIMTHKS